MLTSLIVNPFASRVSRRAVETVVRVLERVGSVEVRQTERAGHAVELAREARGDAIVVFSGDGGFNEVLNGLERDVPVGFVPGGGTSVLPRALGLAREPAAAARRVAVALETGRTRRISLGRVNGRRFAFSAGVGLDAEFIRRVDARGRTSSGRRPGDAYFLWTIARVLWQHRGGLEPVLEVEGLGKAPFVLVANGDPYSYVGARPVRLAPLARFELGLDLVAPFSVSRGKLPRYARYALRGHGQEAAADVIYAHDGDRFAVHCDRPMPLQADGEDLGDVEDVVFEAERDAVSVLW